MTCEPMLGDHQLPKARIVAYQSHVVKGYRDCADSKQELKRLKQELPKAKYDFLNGVTWTFRERPQDLETDEKA